MTKYIFAIESSCDDSSVALMKVKNKELIDCINLSSSSLQNKFGGVVPELAAREHAKNFVCLIQQLFDKHQITWEEIEYIAYTDTPGLLNCLLVGKILAQTLAFLFNKPLLPINHIYGHIFSIGITEKIKFPFLALVASGKTTAIYLVKSPTNIQVLDTTKDNALGEAYDKVARKISLPYPGGKHIDDLFDDESYIPELLINQLSPKKPFSYSGIITASYYLWEKIQKNTDIENKQQYLANVFQKFVINHLMKKIVFWSKETNIKLFAISGGVANNKYLRHLINKTDKKTLEIKIVNIKFASDNAAMIAYYATWLI